MRKLIMAAALGIFCGPALLSSAHAQSTGSCTVKKTDVTAANSIDTSSSIAYVNLTTSGSITFTQAHPGCVGGTFSAAAGNQTTTDNVRLQILLDGSPCAPLTGNQGFAAGVLATFSTEYFCGATVAPGTHTVQVQYHSGSGGVAAFYQRILSVRHD